MRINVSICWLLLAVVVSADDTSAPTATTVPSPPAVDSLPGVHAPPAATGSPIVELASTAVGQTSRILTNFYQLGKGNWQDVAGEVAGAIGWLILGLIGGLVLGNVAGVGIYLLLRKRAYFETPWQWMRWVSWLWPVAFVICFSVAGAIVVPSIVSAADAVLTVRKHRPVERVAANLYAAVALDGFGYEVQNDDTAADLAEILTKYENLRAVACGKLAEALEQIIADLESDTDWETMTAWGSAALQRFLVRQVSRRLASATETEVTWVADIGLLALAEMSPSHWTVYQESHDDAALRLEIVQDHFARFRTSITITIVAMAAQAVVISVVIWLLPLFLVLWMLRYSVRRFGDEEMEPLINVN